MNLKRLLTLFVSIILSFLIFVGIIAVLMLNNHHEAVERQEIHFQSYKIAIELKYSSDELTRCCRTFVSTGQGEWEQRYWEILDIRNGKKPRPDGRTISIVDSMRKLGFTEAEFDKLKEAEKNSNDLVYTEKVAFHAMKGLFDDGRGQFTVKKAPDPNFARRIMYDKKYLAAKENIMKPISEFLTMIEKRTSGTLNFDNNTMYRRLIKIIVLITIISIISFISFFILRNKIIYQLEELKNAHKIISDSEERYRNFIDHSIAGVTRVNLDGIIISTNKAFAEILEYDSVDELVGRHIMDFYKYPERRKVLLDEIYRKKTATNFEVELLTKHGNCRTLILNTVLENNIMEGTVIDVTELKNAEDLLREDEDKFRRLFEMSPVGMALIDFETRKFIKINDAVINSTLYTKEELKNITYWDLTPEEYEAEELNKIELLKTEGSFGPQYQEYIRKDGTRYPIIVNGFLFKDINGKEVIWVMIEDITSQKKMEAELKLNYDRLYFMLANLFSGVILVSENNKVEFLNESFCRFFNIDKQPAELIGIPSSEIVSMAYNSFDEEDKYAQRIREIIAKAEPVSGEEIVLKNGKTLLRDYIPLYIDGIPCGRLWNHNDITMQKSTEKKLKDLAEELSTINKTKDKFFSLIAHDLKSPFQGLIGYSSILVKEYSELDEQRRLSYINRIEELSINTYTLLENLLEWSRLQTRSVSFTKEDLNLFPELYSTLSILKHNASLKNIELCNLINESIVVYADKFMLNAIVRNLVSNAIKYTRKSGKITLNAKYKMDAVEISVADNGVGISPENMKKLFKIELSQSTRGTENEKGTGIGLLLCKEMVEKHGGEIWAESTVDKGSTFYFTLPIN